MSIDTPMRARDPKRDGARDQCEGIVALIRLALGGFDRELTPHSRGQVRLQYRINYRLKCLPSHQIRPVNLRATGVSIKPSEEAGMKQRGRAVGRKREMRRKDGTRK